MGSLSFSGAGVGSRDEGGLEGGVQLGRCEACGEASVATLLICGGSGNPTTSVVVGTVGETGGTIWGQVRSPLQHGKPVEYPQTAGTGCGLSRCGRFQHHTHTHETRDQKTAGKPVPVINPSTHTPQSFFLND
jgi:hypothetical protein